MNNEQRTTILPGDQVKPLLDEANELVAIFLSSIQTARGNADD